MKSRAWWAAGIAFAVGIAMQWLYMRRFEARVSGGEPLTVVVALRDLRAGEVLETEALGTRVIPAAYVDLRHVLAKDSADLLGQPIHTAIRAGEALLWSDLELDPTRDATLSDLIRPGMRAITLSSVRDTGLTALLRPGDRVDVFASTGAGIANGTTVHALVQNVLVLAIGTSLREPDKAQGAGTGDARVTVSVTMQDARRLAEAERSGRLSLALRNQDDGVIEEAAVMSPPSPPSPSRHLSARAPAREIEHVE